MQEIQEMLRPPLGGVDEQEGSKMNRKKKNNLADQVGFPTMTVTGKLPDYMKPEVPTIVNVRFFDGCLETFEAQEVRFGSDLLWMRLKDSSNRHIPLRQVRWFSLSPPSHEKRGRR